MLKSSVRLLVITAIIVSLISFGIKATKFGGQVRLVFWPARMTLTPGEEEIGYVNVSVDHAVFSPTTVIHACCVDTDVITILSPSSLYLNLNRSTNIFNISVRSKNLGRTSVRFYLICDWGNTTLVAPSNAGHFEQITDRNIMDTSANRTSASSNSSVCNRGMNLYRNVEHNSSYPRGLKWLQGRYEIIVYQEPAAGGRYLYYVSMGMMAVNMIGIGGQVDRQVVVDLLRRPVAVSLALFCRFVAAPALGLGLVELVQPSHIISLGVLSLLCAPGEGASNILLLLMEGDLTLSVTITTINNLASVAMLPLWAIVVEHRLYDYEGIIYIPFRQLLVLFGSTTATLALGVVIQQYCSRFYAKLWRFIPSLSVFTLVSIVAVALYDFVHIVHLVSDKIVLLSSLLAASGFSLGAIVSFTCRQSLNTLLIITIDTGIRTVFIANLLTRGSLDPADCNLAQTAPTLCILLSLVPCSIFVLVRRSILKYRFRFFDPRSENTVSAVDCGEVTEADILVEDDEMGDDVQRVVTSSETLM